MLWLISAPAATRTCFADDHITVLAVCLPDARSSEDGGSDESEEEGEEGEEDAGQTNSTAKDTGTDDGSSTDSDSESSSSSGDDEDDNEDSSEGESDESDSNNRPQVPAAEIAPSLQLYVRDWSMYPRSVFKKPTTRSFPNVKQGQSKFSAPRSPLGAERGPAPSASVCVECEALWPQPLLGYTITSTGTGRPLVVALNVSCEHVLTYCARHDLPSLCVNDTS